MLYSPHFCGYVYPVMLHIQAPKKQGDDWHPADIVAALRKAGWSLRQLDRKFKLGSCTIQGALHRPIPRYERIIAKHIGVPPQRIWPSRYDEHGLPNRRRGPKPNAKSTAGASRRNVNRKAAG